MARREDLPARRNAAILAGTGAVLTLLMMDPTSTNSATSPRRPGQALAAAGVVTSPVRAEAVAMTTINGRSIDTKYGPVQVQITLRGGQLLSAIAIDYPQTGDRDIQINTYAIPVLQQEALLAHNATIDTVSGATFTSAGYRTSLQSALDTAHLR